MSISSQSSSSSSTPTFLETPENSIINQISSVAQGLASQMQNWAQGVYAQTSQITNAAVGNFFQTSQNMLGMSNKLTDQYNNVFAPENKQLVDEANSYASPGRMAVDMGQAGATQAQAGDHALHNSEEALRSYGIDPSSGRYAALDKAAAVQNAANIAGAQNTQRNADIATGHRLRSEAVQVGATMPAAIANINNTAIQANTGASNATLANANTGRNLMALPNDYLKTAMDVKLPISGQNSQSRGSGMSSSPDKGGGGGHGGGSGAGAPGPGAAAHASPAWMPDHSGAGSQAIMQSPGFAGNYNDPTGQQYDPLSGMDAGGFDGSSDYYQPQEGYGMGIGEAGSNAGYNDYGGNPFDNSGFGQNLPADQFGGADQTYGNMGGGTDTQFGNISYDSGANNYDPGWGQTYNQPNPDTNWGSGADAYSGGGNSGFNDYGMGGGLAVPSDTSFAQGGAVPDAGAVPSSMSPSGGQQVDDVSAQGPQGHINLNAGEFVIPRDVALWKGQEFFQNLIDQSRKKRVTAPAKPTAGPPQAGKTNPPMR